jgi:hypothetical protein
VIVDGSVLSTTGASIDVSGGTGSQTGSDGRFLFGNNTGTAFAGTVAGAAVSNATTLLGGPQDSVPFLPGWALNGGAAINSGGATLTDALAQDRSLWSNQQVGVNSWSASFVYTDAALAAGSNGNGFAFVLQNFGTTALGAGDAGLGYQNIPTSFAVAFNVSSAYQVGYSFLTNGVVTHTYLPTGAVNLASGLPVTVNLSYDGTTLTLTLTQGTSTFQTSTGIDLASVLGSSTAYVGFTAASGIQGSTQTVGQFRYTDLSTNPARVTTFASPLVPNLLSSKDATNYVGVAEAYGLTNLSTSDFHLTPGTDQSLATELVSTGPGGYNTAFKGFSYLFLINDSTSTLTNPKLGIGTTPTALLNGGWVTNSGFNGFGATTLGSLKPGQVYAVLVPNGQTNYNVSFQNGGQTIAAQLNSGNALALGQAYFTSIFPASTTSAGASLPPPILLVAGGSSLGVVTTATNQLVLLSPLFFGNLQWVSGFVVGGADGLPEAVFILWDQRSGRLLTVRAGGAVLWQLAQELAGLPNGGLVATVGPDGFLLFILGTERNGKPSVAVFSGQTGALLRTFDPFRSSFKGLAHVRMLTSHGVPKLVVSDPGQGTIILDARTLL